MSIALNSASSGSKDYDESDLAQAAAAKRLHNPEVVYGRGEELTPNAVRPQNLLAQQEINRRDLIKLFGVGGLAATLTAIVSHFISKHLNWYDLKGGKNLPLINFEKVPLGNNGLFCDITVFIESRGIDQDDNETYLPHVTITVGGLEPRHSNGSPGHIKFVIEPSGPTASQLKLSAKTISNVSDSPPHETIAYLHNHLSDVDAPESVDAATEALRKYSTLNPKTYLEIQKMTEEQKKDLVLKIAQLCLARLDEEEKKMTSALAQGLGD